MAAGAALVLVLGIVIAVALRVVPSRTAATTAATFRTEQAVVGSVAATVSATGKIEPLGEVSVGSEISGKIAEVLVNFNDRVTARQVLARFQTDNLEASVAAAVASLKSLTAEVAQAEATEREASAQRERQVQLESAAFVSRQRVEDAEAALERARQQVKIARAKVEAQEAALQLAQSTLKRAVIVSPIDGIVLDRAVEPGQTVAASFNAPKLFQIARDLRQIRVRALVDEADIGSVRQDATVNFWVDAYPGKIFQGTVRNILKKPTTVQNVVFYEVIVEGQNPDVALLPGMTATLRIDSTMREGVTVVPNAALFFTPVDADRRAEQAKAMKREGPGTGRSGVLWIVEADGNLAPRVVRLGQANASHTEVTSGIEPGQAVVVGYAR